MSLKTDDFKIKCENVSEETKVDTVTTAIYETNSLFFNYLPHINWDIHVFNS